MNALCLTGIAAQTVSDYKSKDRITFCPGWFVKVKKNDPQISDMAPHVHEEFKIHDFRNKAARMYVSNTIVKTPM